MSFSAPPCRPWCGAFVHQAFLRAGIRLSPRIRVRTTTRGLRYALLAARVTR